MTFIRIFTGNEVAVRKLKSLLEDRSIESSIQNTQDGLSAYGVEHYSAKQLFIKTEDSDKAKPILETFLKTS